MPGGSDFASFLDQELDGLGRLAGVLTGDAADAGDLLTSVVTSAGAGWDKMSARTDRLAYVRRIAVIAFLGDRRTADAAAAGTADATGASARPTVGRALTGLPPRRLAALVLRDYLKLPESVARAALGASVATYRTHLTNAEDRVRSVLALSADQVDDDGLRDRITRALTARERFVPTDLPAVRRVALEQAPAANRNPVRRSGISPPLIAAALVVLVVLVGVLAIVLTR